MAHRQKEKHVNRAIGDSFQALDAKPRPAAIEPKPSTNHTTPYQQPSLPLEERSTFSVDFEAKGEDIAGECGRTALPA